MGLAFELFNSHYNQTSKIYDESVLRETTTD